MEDQLTACYSKLEGETDNLSRILDGCIAEI